MQGYADRKERENPECLWNVVLYKVPCDLNYERQNERSMDQNENSLSNLQILLDSQPPSIHQPNFITTGDPDHESSFAHSVTAEPIHIVRTQPNARSNVT